jgi:hypothetical protein
MRETVPSKQRAPSKKQRQGSQYGSPMDTAAETGASTTSSEGGYGEVGNVDPDEYDRALENSLYEHEPPSPACAPMEGRRLRK